MLAYLSGSIEYSPDFGKSWRMEITPFLRELGHDVYDPARDEKKNLEETEVREFRKWKTTDLPRFQQTVRKIIEWDLDWIEKSDYLVCFWDDAAGRGAGTQGELTFAHRYGIPVYVVLGMPLAQVSGWILGCASEVFEDFEQLQLFLADKFSAVELTTEN
jgi:nucleoside 2-deoxyribosyltransferase